MKHVKYGNTFVLIYVDFHTLELGDFWDFAFFWVLALLSRVVFVSPAIMDFI